MSERVPGLFISGTDTGVGKTYVAGLIVQSLVAAGRRVGVYKPAASGCRREGDTLVSDDALALWGAAGRVGELDRVCPQRFEAPLAPDLAAKQEGKRLEPDLIRRGIEYWQERSEVIVVEGVGGLMTPLGEEEFVADLVYDFGFPLVVVTRNSLGMISQTLQTLITSAAFHDGLPLAGIVVNSPAPAGDDASCSSNREELAARCVPPILAEVAWGAQRFDVEVDWFALAK